MIDASEFNELINHLNINEIINTCGVSSTLHTELQTKIDFVNAFNRKHENKFKFCSLDKQIKQKLGQSLTDTLKKTWTCLNKSETSSDETSILKALYLNLTSSCLNFIRLVSRDSELIDSFENSELLAQIQIIANLSLAQLENLSLEETTVVDSMLTTTDREILNVNALKSISNLTYNSKFVQDFYAENGVGEAITLHLRLFNSAAYSNYAPTANEENNSYNIMIFNLRILFLLTILNKTLRQKLKEQLEVLTYLIEIIDQIMKERLNVNVDDANVLLNNCVSLSNGSDQADFCYLKLIDIEYIIEILKILFNLTMDITSVKANAAAAMGSYGRNPIVEATDHTCMSFFYEKY